MPLQKPMRGIREFLGSYQRPTDQFDLFPSILPAVDMSDFLQEPEIERAALSVTAVGQAVTVMVPAGEIWRVRAIASEGFIAAATSLQIQPVYFNKDRFFVLNSEAGFSFPKNITNSNGGLGIFTPGLTLFADMAAGVQVYNITGTVQLAVEVHFQRIFV